MTQDEIIRMAREADFYKLPVDERLERFAALVRAEYEAPLKLAENTLRDIIRVYKFEGGTPVTALAAIREALAEQEKLVPKVSHGLCGGCAKTAADGWALYCVECWEKAEPVKQEPVYAFRRRGLDDFCTCTKERYEELADMPNLFEVTTFYAAPVSAKLEWVDLTDDEIYPLYNEPISDREAIDFARAVIAAFKEKNK